MDYSNPYDQNNNNAATDNSQYNYNNQNYNNNNNNQQYDQQYQQNNYDQNQNYNYNNNQNYNQQYNQQPNYQQQQPQGYQQPNQTPQQNQQPQQQNNVAKSTQPAFSYKPQNDGDLELEVSEAIVFKDTLGKHHKYPIKGRDSNGEIDIQRRYSEFAKFREILVRNFIGLYIPPIPEKQVMNKNDDAVARERQYFLNLFCKQCCQLKYLVSSYELQVFLRPQGKCEDSLSKIARPRTDDILGVYRATCPINENTDDRSIIFFTTEIREFAKGQKQLLDTFKQFKSTLKNIAPLKDQENKYYKEFAAFLTKYEDLHDKFQAQGESAGIRFTGENSKLTDRLNFLAENQGNPYMFTRNWVKGEIYALQAVLSAIDAKDDIDKKKRQAKSTLADKIETSQKLKAGKFTFKGMLKNQAEKEQTAQTMETAIKQLEDDLVNYDEMKNYVTVHLYTEALPEFKRKRVNNYLTSMEMMSQSELRNAVQSSDAWIELQHQLEVYKI